MIENIIKLATAKLAKEKGFDEYTEWYYFPAAYEMAIADEDENPNITYYGKNPKNNSLATARHNSETLMVLYSAPTQSALRDWLRTVHEIEIDCPPRFLELELVRALYFV